MANADAPEVGGETVPAGAERPAPPARSGILAPKPGVPPWLHWGRIVGAVVLLGLAFWIPQYYTAETLEPLSRVFYIAVAAMGLNLLTGYNGQISIGHGAFFGIGAFTSAILVKDHGVVFEATIPVAAAVAAGVGILVGIPALRVRGLYLALVTLGLAVLFPVVVSKYVKADGGIAQVKPDRRDLGSYWPDLFQDDQYKYYVCLVVALFLTVLAWNLVRSRTGRAMVAVRDQELAASTLGVSLAQTKVGAFAVSAAYAGIAGSLSVMVEGLANATNPIRYFQLSIEFLVAVILGGAATILGPFVGAFVLVYLRELAEGKRLKDASWAPEWLSSRAELLTPALFGIALIAVVFVLPQGVVGGVRSLVARLTHRAAPPSPMKAIEANLDPDPPTSP